MKKQKSVLFISHSSSDNDLVRQVAELINADTHSQCKTIMDVHDLRQGMAWSPPLYQWMAKCQAALLLLTENALKSNWVLQEAIVLRARKVIDASFPLFVVIPDALRTRLAEDPALAARWQLFEPLNLSEIQGLRSADAQGICNAVVGELAKAGRTETYFDRLAGLLRDILGAYKEKKSTLDFLSGKMALQDAEWQSIYGESNEIVVDMLARRLCQGDLGGFSGVRDLMQSVKSVSDPHTLRNLLHAIASYWVDLGAASAFAAVAQRSSPPRLIAIRSSVFQEYSGALYLARYYRPHRLEPIIVTVSGGNEAAGIDDLEQQFVDAVRASNTALRKKTHAQMIELLKTARDLAFVFLPEQRFEDDAYELARRFPAFVFVVPVAESARVRDTWTRCTWVQPDVTEDQETTRHLDYGNALGLIG